MQHGGSGCESSGVSGKSKARHTSGRLIGLAQPEVRSAGTPRSMYIDREEVLLTLELGSTKRQRSFR